MSTAITAASGHYLLEKGHMEWLEEHLGAVAGTQWSPAKEARDKEMTLAIPLLTGFLLPPIQLEAGSRETHLIVASISIDDEIENSYS
jgi:hypothetical protein